MIYLETGFIGNLYNLKHPRFCWDWYGGTYAATNAAAGFGAVNATPPRTDSAWRPTALPASLENDFGATQAYSFVGIAKHDLGSLNASITVEFWDGAAWVAIPGLSNVAPVDDTAILFLFEARNVTKGRITINSADAPPTLSVVMFGRADEWPRMLRWVGDPLTEGDQVEYENNITQAGNFVGRSVKRRGLQFECQFNHGSEAWRYTDFAAFKEYANAEDAVMFVSPRPNEPREVAFAMCTDVVRASRDLPQGRVAVSVNLSFQGLRYNGG